MKPKRGNGFYHNLKTQLPISIQISTSSPSTHCLAFKYTLSCSRPFTFPPSLLCPGHIQFNLPTHRFLLTIRQKPIAHGIPWQPLLIQIWNLFWIHRYKFILLIPMTDITSPPFVLSFFPRKAEPTITFGIDVAALESKSLSDGSFHVSHCPGSRRVDVGCGTVDTVHDPGPFIHTFLRGSNEVGDGGASCPCCVYVSSFMKD